MKKLHKNQSGFTIVELMVATAVFSVVLLVVLGGFIYVSRTFYKGLTLARTNEVARGSLDSIERDLRFSKSDVFTNVSGGKNIMCVGTVKYIWDTSQYTSGGLTSGLQRSVTSGACSPDTTPGSNVQQLLSENMRVQNLRFNNTNIAPNSVPCLERGICEVDLIIAYGDDGAFDDMDGTLGFEPCKGSLVDSQFCAVTRLHSVLYRNGGS